MYKDKKKERQKQQMQQSFTELVYGKVPPGADAETKELEQAVIGALLLEPDAYDKVATMLHAEIFYVPAHQLIFKAIRTIIMRNQIPDLLLVVQELKNSGELEAAGSPYYITKCTNAVVSSANIVAHVGIIFQKYISREIIRICGNAMQLCYEDYTDPFDMLFDAVQAFNEINDKLNATGEKSLDQLRIEIITTFDERFRNGQAGIVDPNALYTYIREWDEVNGRLFPGLYYIAARPAVGKSIVATQLTVNMGEKIPVGFVNVEMTNKQLLIRIGNNMENLSNEIWRKKDHEITEADRYWVEKAINATSRLKLFLCDDNHIDKVVTKIRYWVRKCGVKVIIVDIFTALRGPSDMRFTDKREEMNYCNGLLRDLAKELEVPIFILTHLNRNNEHRSGKADSKEPTLSDIKGSGDIEDFAFQVMVLHRPELYGQTEDEDNNSTRGLLKMKIVKHREGELAVIKKHLKGSMSQVRDWQDNLNDWRPLPALPITKTNPYKSDDFTEGINPQNEF